MYLPVMIFFYPLSLRLYNLIKDSGGLNFLRFNSSSLKNTADQLICHKTLFSTLSPRPFNLINIEIKKQVKISNHIL